MMKRDIALKGKFKAYFKSTPYLAVFWAILVILLFFTDKKACVLAGTFLGIYLIITIVFYRMFSAKVLNDLVTFAMQYGKVQRGLLEDFVLPCAVLSPKGDLIWMNDRFSEIANKEKNYSKHISTVFPEITDEELPGTIDKTECELPVEGKAYRAAMQKIDLKEFADKQNVMDVNAGDYMIAVYLFDETELRDLAKKNEELRMVSGFISIDNYEEALESIEEVRRSLLLALIDRNVNQCFTEYDGIVKKYEKDKYIVAMRWTALEAMRKAKFPILDDVKNVKIGNKMALTLSMGFAYNQGTFISNTEAALTALDLALGRGGDQVVIKDGQRTIFYGGKTESVEKFTRVKARVKAQALREYMISREKVIAMGHRITDIDTLGASIGIYRAAKALGKPAYIVIDGQSSSIAPMITHFRNNPDFAPDMFISAEEAVDIVTRDTVVVVVDTDRPSYTECPELLDMTDTIVVLDHHRQGEEVISGAALSYIEPYASSACEMVAEILQYLDEKIELTNEEADCMYAGIMVDTNNFSTRTGVRTFEAAAFLRRNGADVTRVRKMFRDSIDDYRTRAKAITNAELFMGVYAISICPNEGVPSPTIIGAQAANELLNVVNVKASFVVTEYKGEVYISARAVDEVNVQLIMERLGGGGHMNIAGAQIEGKTPAEVVELLKKTIKEMTEEGDI